MKVYRHIRSKSDTIFAIEQNDLDNIQANLKMLRDPETIESSSSSQVPQPQQQSRISQPPLMHKKVSDDLIIMKRANSRRIKLNELKEVLSFDEFDDIYSRFLFKMFMFKKQFDMQVFRYLSNEKQHLNNLFALVKLDITNFKQNNILSEDDIIYKKIEKFEQLIDIVIQIKPSEYYREVKAMLLNEFETTRIDIQSSIERYSKLKSASKFVVATSQIILYLISMVSYRLDYYSLTMNCLIQRMKSFAINYVEGNAKENVKYVSPRVKNQRMKCLHIIDQFVALSRTFTQEFYGQATCLLFHNKKSVSLNNFSSFGRYIINNFIKAHSNSEDLIIKDETLDERRMINDSNRHVLYWKNYINKLNHLNTIKLDKYFRLFFNLKLVVWKNTALKVDKDKNKKQTEICRICEQAIPINDYILHINYCREQKIFYEQNRTFKQQMEKTIIELIKYKDTIISYEKQHKNQIFKYTNPLVRQMKRISRSSANILEPKEKVTNEQLITELIEIYQNEAKLPLDYYEKNSYKFPQVTSLIYLTLFLYVTNKQTNEVEKDLCSIFSALFSALVNRLMAVEYILTVQESKTKSNLKTAAIAIANNDNNNIPTTEQQKEDIPMTVNNSNISINDDNQSFMQPKTSSEKKVVQFNIDNTIYNSADQSRKSCFGNENLWKDLKTRTFKSQDKSPYLNLQGNRELNSNFTMFFNNYKSKYFSNRNSPLNGQSLSFLPDNSKINTQDDKISTSTDQSMNYNDSSSPSSILSLRLRKNKGLKPVTTCEKNINLRDAMGNLLNINKEDINMTVPRKTPTIVSLTTKHNSNNLSNLTFTSIETDSTGLTLGRKRGITLNHVCSSLDEASPIKCHISGGGSSGSKGFPKKSLFGNTMFNDNKSSSEDDDDDDDNQNDEEVDNIGLGNDVNPNIGESIISSSHDFGSEKSNDVKCDNDDDNGSVISHISESERYASLFKYTEINEVYTSLKTDEIQLMDDLGKNTNDYQPSSINMTLRQSASKQTATPKIEDFEFKIKIAQGGYGRVDIYKKKTTGDFYAIKTVDITSMKNKNLSSTLKKETLILNEINSDYVVKCYYIFNDEKNYYYVMEYMPGGDLFHLLKSSELSESTIQLIVAESILSLVYLHSKNITHKDIKPENILISKDGHFKITDFGLSESDMRKNKYAILRSNKGFDLLDNSIDQNLAVGTLNYMAPEMLTENDCLNNNNNNYIDASPMNSNNSNNVNSNSVDYWALGVLIYELYTFKVPFYAQSTNEIKTNIITMNIDWSHIDSNDMKKMYPNIENGKDLIKKFLVKSPEDRWGDNHLEQIKKHPFFNGFNWNNIKDIKDKEVISYVAKNYLKMNNALKAESKASRKKTAAKLKEDDSIKVNCNTNVDVIVIEGGSDMNNNSNVNNSNSNSNCSNINDTKALRVRKLTNDFYCQRVDNLFAKNQDVLKEKFRKAEVGINEDEDDNNFDSLLDDMQ